MPDPVNRSASARWRQVGGAATVAAFVLFVLAAGWYRFRTDSPFWLDEALTVHIAGLPLSDIGPALRHDGHPPLYYWLLHGWMEAGAETDTAIRALSGIFGVLMIPLAYVVGRQAGGARLGWATLLVVAVSPFAVRYATEARMYSMVMVLVMLGQLLVRGAVRRRSAPAVMLTGVWLVSSALLLTHYWSVFLLAATVVTLILWGRRHGHGDLVRGLVLAIAAGGLLFLPWLSSFRDQAAHTGTPWATAARPTVVVNEVLVAFGGGDHAEAGLLAALVVLLVAIGVFARGGYGGALELRSRPASEVTGEALVVALTLGFGAVAGYLTNSTFAGRYAAVVFPLVAVLVGRGLAVLPGTIVPVAVGGSLVLLSAAGIQANVIEDRTQAGEIAAVVAADVGPDDVVVVCPDQLGPAMRRALDQEGLEATPVLAYPTLDDGRFVDWYDYEDRNDAADPGAVATEILARTPPTGRIWLVSNGSYRTFTGDCEALSAGISASRPGFTPLVGEKVDDVFEPAALAVFEAAG